MTTPRPDIKLSESAAIQPPRLPFLYSLSLARCSAECTWGLYGTYTAALYRVRERGKRKGGLFRAAASHFFHPRSLLWLQLLYIFQRTLFSGSAANMATPPVLAAASYLCIVKVARISNSPQIVCSGSVLRHGQFVVTIKFETCALDFWNLSPAAGTPYAYWVGRETFKFVMWATPRVGNKMCFKFLPAAPLFSFPNECGEGNFEREIRRWSET